MREGKKHPFAINVWRWGLLILLLVLWEIGARLKWIDPFFFSSPLEIARTAVIKWQGGTLWRDIAYTGASTLLGFVLGTLIGHSFTFIRVCTFTHSDNTIFFAAY
mgnify:CR=1 FL=1